MFSFQEYIDAHPETIVLDPLPAIRTLLDRSKSYELIRKIEAYMKGTDTCGLVPVAGGSHREATAWGGRRAGECLIFLGPLGQVAVEFVGAHILGRALFSPVNSRVRKEKPQGAHWEREWLQPLQDGFVLLS